MTSPINIRNFDYVELYVGSARMYAYWFVKAMGFEIIAYKGPENNSRDIVSYFIKKGSIKIVLTSALQPSAYEVNAFVTQHGNGVRRFAFEVDDVEAAFKYSTRERAVPVQYPQKMDDENGFVMQASVGVFDDTELFFINYDHYKGLFIPGYGKPVHTYKINREETYLLSIDHIVGNVRENEMNRWVDYFVKALDFKLLLSFGPGDIETKYTSLLSKVVTSANGIIKIPINEPFEGLKKSQIDEYIEEYHGTGIQHIALSTNNIIEAIKGMRANGVEFISIPDTYYEILKEKHAKLPKDKQIDEDIEVLKSLGILCDFEESGYLLQLFTKPVGDRPTIFFEIIQRKKGAKAFGHGNFQALFEAIERDQSLRGDLVDRKNRSKL
jgi:4-hydroxyphenylpyruvate dioxygenase